MARARADVLSVGFTGEVGFIRLETVIAAPASDCFDLSLSVDAHTVSMRASGERAIGGATSGVLKLGDTVTWRARHFGIVFSMTSAITEYDYPGRFVDEQQRGPFRRWRHEHTFTVINGGTTKMTDVAEFRSPLGAAGQMGKADHCFQLSAGFTGLAAHRHRCARPVSPQIAAGEHIKERHERDEAEHSPRQLCAAPDVTAGCQVNPHQDNGDGMEDTD